MSENTIRLNYLYNSFINDTATPEEVREFWLLFNEAAEDHPVKEAIFQFYNKQQDDLTEKKDWRASDVRLQRHATEEVPKQFRIPLRRKLAWAAAILLLIGSAAYFRFQHNDVPEQAIAKKATTIPGDVAPGQDGAILTLADGSTIVLDSLGNGVIATQNGSKVMLEDGLLAYSPAAGNGKISFNTISTPKGRQFRLVLPDGTKVWLNAASSLRYPTTFSGSERNVQVTGEVYFEVVKDSQKPFKVGINNLSGIEVLGTQFNVNAYTDESTINTTLFEGSVRVYNGDKSINNVILQPGQQAQMTTGSSGSGIQVLNNADPSQVIAWKNGLFNFQDKSLEEAMRQLTRWYDIEVIYEKGIPAITFWGKMERTLTLNSVLSMLQGAGVHFRIEEGRRLVVLQ